MSLRWLYQEFFYRYRVLCKTKDIKRNDMRVTCENILSNLIKVGRRRQPGRGSLSRCENILGNQIGSLYF